MSNSVLKTIAGFLFVLSGALCCQAQDNSAGMSLLETYEGYLSNIQGRNFKGVETYFTSADSIQFVDAGGKVQLSMDGYRSQVQKFMNDTAWKEYKSKLISLKQHGNTGIIMERAEISGTNWVFAMVVTYVFEKMGGRWKMVADLCTKIEE